MHVLQNRRQAHLTGMVLVDVDDARPFLIGQIRRIVGFVIIAVLLQIKIVLG